MSRGPVDRTGGVTLQRTRWRGRQRPLPPPLRIVGGLLLLVICGTLLLMLPGVGRQRPLEWNEALFTATSALSVTGLTVIMPVVDLTFIGQVILLVLIQIGGVGFMVTAVLAFRILGRRVSLLDRIALSDSLGLIEPRAILKLSRQVLATVLLIEGAGAVALWWNWRDQLAPGEAVFYAVFHAVAAFCNAGFNLFSGLPNYPTGLPRDNVTLTVIGTLIFLGTLGVPVLADILSWRRDRHFTLHTKITLVVVSALVVIGAVGLLLAESRSAGVLVGEPWHRRVLMVFFQSISARSGGFDGLPEFYSVTPPSILLLIALMFIGGAPASMGGGITTGTFATLTLALWGYARGLPSAQVAGRTIATGMVRKAAAVLTISLFVVLLATWLILMSHKDAQFEVVLFEVVSAFATCGLSLGFTGQLNVFGQLVIVLMMFWGRLGALTIVVALAQQRRPQPFTYPEEQIFIG